MKRISTLACAFILAACATEISAPRERESAESDSPPQELREKLSSAIAEPDEDRAEIAPEQPRADADTNYLTVADWLVQRKGVCNQNREAIDAQLHRYQSSLDHGIPSDGEERLVHAHSQLKALMLASCDPARTPGLLDRILKSVLAADAWPPEYDALFDLLESEQAAYALLERKYRELESRHQRTIEGIGNIERSLETSVEPSS